MKRAALVTLFAASALILSGCVTVVVPDDNSRDDTTPTVDELDNRTDVSCTPGEERFLNEPSTLYTVSGPCEDVTVEGTDLIVRFEQIENLVIRGDRNLVEGLGIESVAISGQDNTVTADSVEEVEIAGDRNTVSSHKKIDDTDVTGNDNEFDLR
jgi:hypothetical protein